MTTLAAAMFAGTINPGQLEIVREIVTTPTARRHRYCDVPGRRREYTFAGDADGNV